MRGRDPSVMQSEGWINKAWGKGMLTTTPEKKALQKKKKKLFFLKHTMRFLNCVLPGYSVTTTKPSPFSFARLLLSIPTLHIWNHLCLAINLSLT